jgi:hypothetical protein
MQEKPLAHPENQERLWQLSIFFTLTNGLGQRLIGFHSALATWMRLHSQSGLLA